MNEEAESSRATDRNGESFPELVDPDQAADEEELQRQKAQLAKERRLDAKRKRIRMLNELLRDLDLMVYVELLTVYHLDCSFFWLAIKAFMHVNVFSPGPDPLGERPPDPPKPFLPVILFSFLLMSVLHQIHPAPSAGEDTRGYLHGGLMIDFIGQQGPTSKWKLGALDVCIMLLQLVMVSVHVKRRELKEKLAKLSAGTSSSNPTTSDATADGTASSVQTENAARGQDADDEERGVLHRTDTLSELGADLDEEDALLTSLDTSDAGHLDALDILTSGQYVIGDFTLVNTLLEENKNNSAYLLTRSESGMSGMPETLRRLNTLRARLGTVGG